MTLSEGKLSIRRRKRWNKILAPATDMELIKLVVPTVFGASIQAVYEAMVLHQPDVVLCIGQAGGRTAITVEQIAINLMDTAIPDNQGNQPHDEPVFANGADGYFSTLPVKDMVAAIRNAGIPAADLLFRRHIRVQSADVLAFCITFIMNFPIPGADSSMSLIFRFRLPL